MNKWENQIIEENKRKKYLDERGIKIILIEKIVKGHKENENVYYGKQTGHEVAYERTLYDAY